MKRRWIAAAVGMAMAAAPGAVATAKVQQAQATLTTQRVPLGRMLPGVIEKTIVVSPDSTRVAYLAGRNSTLLFGFSGEVVDGTWFVVVDGVEGKGYNYIGAGKLALKGPQESFPVGAHGLSRGKTYEELGLLDWVGDRPVVFSPDSKHVAYVAGRHNKQFVVVDGVEGKEWDVVRHVAFSPDSTRVAYSASDGGRWRVVVDGMAGQEHDALLGLGCPVFSPDSRRVAYVVRTLDKESVVVDGIQGREFDGIQLDRPVFSPNSQRLAYLAMAGRKRLLVVDGQQGREYDGCVGLPFFSPDSQRVGFVARGPEKTTYPDWSGIPLIEQGQAFLVLDGEEGRQYGYVGLVAFSSDGKRMAYSAGSCIVVDGRNGRKARTVGDPVFSPDGTRLAYGTENARGCSVVVDDVEGKRYDDVDFGSISFSPDGRHVAYAARRGRKWLAVVDGLETDGYERFFPNSNIVFDSTGKLHILALQGGELLRVEVEIPGEDKPAEQSREDLVPALPDQTSR